MPQASQVHQWMIGYLGELLDLPEADIDPEAHLANYGLDSTDVMVIAGALEEQFSLEVDPIFFLRNATVKDIVDDLKNSGIVG